MWIVFTVYVPKVPWWGDLLIALGLGLIAAAISFFIWQLGVVLLGFSLGTTVASLLLSTPLGTKVLTNYWAHFGITLGLAIVFAIIAIFLQRIIVIVGTSAVGAFLFCNAIDIAWLHSGILYGILVEIISREPGLYPPINTVSAYILLGGDLALVIFGTLIQLLVTARKYDHKKHVTKIRIVDYDSENAPLVLNSMYRD